MRFIRVEGKGLESAIQRTIKIKGISTNPRIKSGDGNRTQPSATSTTGTMLAYKKRAPFCSTARASGYSCRYMELYVRAAGFGETTVTGACFPYYFTQIGSRSLDVLLLMFRWLEPSAFMIQI